MAAAKGGAKKRTVLDVVREKTARPRAGLTAEQLEQVKQAIEYNDKQPSSRTRISSVDVCNLLRSEYGYQLQRCALERAACEALGRRSWSCK